MSVVMVQPTVPEVRGIVEYGVDTVAVDEAKPPVSDIVVSSVRLILSFLSIGELLVHRSKGPWRGTSDAGES
jgi:hypothetical protein